MNYGQVTLGTVGYEDHMRCTVMSSEVNIASRLESMNKQFGSTVLLSDTFVQAFGSSTKNHQIRYLGKWQVRGKSEPIPLYEYYGHYSAELKEVIEKTREEFEEAVHMAEQGDWISSKAKFEDLQKRYPQDHATLFLSSLSSLQTKRLAA